ncbi:hypothetical protein GJ700_12495 [Duganella sp. FT92W]|uniref:Uncharacterized protein n=1 Tax=Pseudoduganella rivuli TaxID=2666085 RepID=A0A7X2IMF1_9BURK|nr:hypothetical protein [Pseudoduganella rivuli]MRV72529.1 hypothetical protein [Pseudoduganella rivuli]
MFAANELSPGEQLRDAIDRHVLMLARAAQTARPVIYRDLQCYIHVVRIDADTGAEIYLKGNPAPLKPEDLKLAPKIED